MSAKLDPRTGAETAVSPRARSLADTVAGAPWRQTQVWDLGQPPSTVRSDTVCKLTHCKPMCEFGGMGARRADPSDTLPPVDEILVEYVIHVSTSLRAIAHGRTPNPLDLGISAPLVRPTFCLISADVVQTLKPAKRLRSIRSQCLPVQGPICVISGRNC